MVVLVLQTHFDILSTISWAVYFSRSDLIKYTRISTFWKYLDLRDIKRHFFVVVEIIRNIIRNHLGREKKILYMKAVHVDSILAYILKEVHACTSSSFRWSGARGATFYFLKFSLSWHSVVNFTILVNTIVGSRLLLFRVQLVYWFVYFWYPRILPDFGFTFFDDKRQHRDTAAVGYMRQRNRGAWIHWAGVSAVGG